MGDYQYTEYDQYDNGIKTHDSANNEQDEPTNPRDQLNTNLNNANDNYYAYLLLIFVGSLFCSYTFSMLHHKIIQKCKKCKQNKSLKEKIVQHETNIMCSICLEDFKINDKYIEFECKHIYHKECIKEWFKKQQNCPNCRKNII